MKAKLRPVLIADGNSIVGNVKVTKMWQCKRCGSYMPGDDYRCDCEDGFGDRD